MTLFLSQHAFLAINTSHIRKNTKENLQIPIFDIVCLGKLPGFFSCEIMSHV